MRVMIVVAAIVCGSIDREQRWRCNNANGLRFSLLVHHRELKAVPQLSGAVRLRFGVNLPPRLTPNFYAR